ncbi:MAG: Tm-1-like ATP-binding domain-containing protein [Planctomycetales bacterium]|nr:Tm-1-like ATP-binding domain-containing protein [Planctomycetales bacterium]
MSTAVYAVATMDTKEAELTFVAQCLREAGITVKTVDVGTLNEPRAAADVSRQDVLGIAGQRPFGEDRGTAVTAMGEALREYMRHEVAAGRVAGILGIGGSGGTALITTAMRALPIGLPKLMLSTVASGNTAPYVDCSDIAMMYSVVDVAGLNIVSRRIFANAAHAMAGMVRQPKHTQETRPALGMTMFGVTTPCVTQVRETLESQGFDCLVFHATGTGGRAMEKLVASGLLRGVLDITTTEVADEVVGGVFPAGGARFEHLVRGGIPLVLSVGATDMVNFGALDTVPPQFADRLLHVHNAQVTLMRTNEDENRRIGQWIAQKLNHATAPFTLLLPEGGVSMLDAPGQPFHDPVASGTLLATLEAEIIPGPGRQVLRLPHHINDPEFADALVAHFRALWNDANG